MNVDVKQLPFLDFVCSSTKFLFQTVYEIILPVILSDLLSKF